MSAALPEQVPDFRALGVHAHSPADGLTGCTNLPALNDPNITTKLEKLDTVTTDIDSFKRDLIASITEALTEFINKKFDDFTKRLDAVEQKAGAVEQSLRISIAAREMNELVRTRNRTLKPVPLHSVFTNEPIANFPKSIAQFRKLNDTTVAQILKDIDDPFHKPNYGSLLEKRQRLAMLTGINPSRNRVILAPAANADADAADDANDVDDDDDDDDDDDE